jgi:hypothetical protein
LPGYNSIICKHCLLILSPGFWEIECKLDLTFGIGPDTTVSCPKCEEQLTVAQMAASQSDKKELLLKVRLRHDMEDAHEWTILTNDISTASVGKSCEDYQAFVSAPFLSLEKKRGMSNASLSTR